MDPVRDLFRSVLGTPPADLLWLALLGMVGMVAAVATTRLWHRIEPRVRGAGRLLGWRPLEHAGPVRRAAFWGALCLALLGVALMAQARVTGR